MQYWHRRIIILWIIRFSVRLWLMKTGISSHCYKLNFYLVQCWNTNKIYVDSLGVIFWLTMTGISSHRFKLNFNQVHCCETNRYFFIIISYELSPKEHLSKSKTKSMNDIEADGSLITKAYIHLKHISFSKNNKAATLYNLFKNMMK